MRVQSKAESDETPALAKASSFENQVVKKCLCVKKNNMVRVADSVKTSEGDVMAALKGSGFARRYRGGYGSGLVHIPHLAGGSTGKSVHVLSQGETLETLDRAAQKGGKKAGVTRISGKASRPY